MAEGINVPVLVGAVPLLCVTNLVIEEGYRTASIAGSRLTQLISPTNKTITIEALLVNEFRALRPALETLALVSRGLASVTAPLMALAGLPVITKTSVHLDMQITSLTFTQKPSPRDTLSVNIKLTHVPRAKESSVLGLLGDVALGVAGPFL